MAESAHALSTTDKVAILTLIGSAIGQGFPMNASTRSFILLFALGGGLFLCWKALWAGWKKWVVAALIVIVYIAVVLLLLEHEARATKSIAPTTTAIYSIVNTLWVIPWRLVLVVAVTAVLTLLLTQRFSSVGSSGFLGGLTRSAQGSIREPCADQGLHQKAEDDLSKIKNLVRVVGIHYQPVFHKAYIDFTFSVFNVSLYDIVINNVLSGSILFGEDWEKFHYRRPHVEPESPVLCKARSGEWFVIRQALRREEIDRFKEHDYMIAFSDLVIEFKATKHPDQVTQLDLQQLYLETKKGGLRRLDNLDVIFMYSDEQWAALKNQDELNALRKQAKVLQEGMKNRKVIFQVDDTKSQVHITGGTSTRRIEANIRLRCEKAISDAVAIKEFHAALYQETSNGDTVIVEREHAQVVWAEPKMEQVSMENGWTINEPLTPYRWFNFFLDIPRDVETKIDRDHFIRVSMLAVGQESRSADFHVDSWSDARHGNSTISIR